MAYSFLLILQLIYSVCRPTDATLWEAVQASSANISYFRKLVNDSKTSSFLDFGVVTAFIPTNEAYLKRYPSGIDSLTLETKTGLVKSHLANLLSKERNPIKAVTSIFSGSSVVQQGKNGFGGGKFIELKCVSPITPMYMVKSINETSKGFDYFINNAELMPPNIDQSGGNGAFHVINEVIHPEGSDDNLLAYLNKNETYRDFVGFIGKLSSSDAVENNLKNIFNGNEGTYKYSFFVPTNAALNIPAEVKTAIMNNSTRLKDFLMSHVAPNQVIFSSWMQYRPEVKIQMMFTEANPTAKPLNSTIYLNTMTRSIYVSSGGVTAKVLDDTQPLGNGLLLVINQPLNLLYRNMRSILTSKAPAFLAACDGIPECKDYVDGKNGEATIFAPTTFPTSLSSNSMVKEIVMLHIFPGRRLTVATMPAVTVEYDSANSTGKLRFQQTTAGNWVYGRLASLVRGVYSQGFVGSMISEADIAGTNGVVQILNTHLGYPTKSIFQVLQDRFSEFSRLVTYLNNFDINLKELNSQKQHYTFFAPTNAALNAMGEGEGKKILDNMNDRNALFKRLLLLNTVLLSNLTLNQQYEATTAMPFTDNKFERMMMKITMTTNRMKGADGNLINVTQASINIGATNSYSTVKPYESEWGANNGIVYSLNAVPYDASTVARLCKTGSTCKGSQNSRVSWVWSAVVLFIGQSILRTF